MEIFDLLKTILLTIPETALNIFFAFLIIGESRNLPFKCGSEDRKETILKFIASVVLISLFVDAIKIFIASELIQPLLSMIFYTVIICLVYKMNILKSILAVVVLVVFMLMIESPVMSLVISLKFKSLNNFKNSCPFVIFLYSLPVRLIQTMFIVSVWNIKPAMDCIKKSKRVNINKFSLIFAIMLLLTFEISMFHNFLETFETMSMSSKIASFAGILSMGIFNYIAFTMYINTVNRIVRLESILNKNRRC